MAGLHTELVGNGRPRFAFLPGLFGRGRNWTQVAQALAAEGHASVLFDLPDHGKSSWTTEFSYPGMAQAVADELDLRLGSAASVILVGHSMGGKVAMLTALNHPDLVAALVVIDIAPGASDQVDTFTPLVAAMRSLDLPALSTRADADQAMRAAVPDDDVRLFLLQNLRRKGGWHWQQNLALLGDSLPQIGDWPDTGDATLPRTRAVAHRPAVRLRQARARGHDGPALPCRPPPGGARRRALGARRPAPGRRRRPARRRRRAGPRRQPTVAEVITAGSFGLPVPSPQAPSCPPAAMSVTTLRPAASTAPNTV